MPRAQRVCKRARCGKVATWDGFCGDHAREAQVRRGTRQARGYDARHDALRAQWEPLVRRGTVTCWRCKRLIAPDAVWHLGHDDKDRTQYRGPEHAACNLGGVRA